MNEFLGDDVVKLDCAIEGMAEMIAHKHKLQRNETDPKVISKLEEELNILLKERDLMYQGDSAIIEKILTVYAAEIREFHKN